MNFWIWKLVIIDCLSLKLLSRIWKQITQLFYTVSGVIAVVFQCCTCLAKMISQKGGNIYIRQLMPQQGRNRNKQNNAGATLKRGSVTRFLRFFLYIIRTLGQQVLISRHNMFLMSWAVALLQYLLFFVWGAIPRHKGIKCTRFVVGSGWSLWPKGIESYVIFSSMDDSFC